MNETILKELNIAVCECGMLIQIDKAKEDQYDLGRKKQKINCLVCKRRIWNEGDK